MDYAKFLKKLVSETRVVDKETKTLLLELLKKTKKTNTFLHGDLHLGNILLADNQVYWIDMGGFAFGNPLFDLGKHAFVASVMADQPIMKDILHIDYQTFKKMWPTFLKEYFNCEDNEVNHYSDMAICYTLFFHIFACDVWNSDIVPKDKINFLINHLEKVVPTL